MVHATHYNTTYCINIIRSADHFHRIHLTKRKHFHAVDSKDILFLALPIFAGVMNNSKQPPARPQVLTI